MSYNASIIFERSGHDDKTIHVYVVYEHALAGVHAFFAYLKHRLFRFGRGRTHLLFYLPS